VALEKLDVHDARVGGVAADQGEHLVGHVDPGRTALTGVGIERGPEHSGLVSEAAATDLGGRGGGGVFLTHDLTDPLDRRRPLGRGRGGTRSAPSILAVDLAAARRLLRERTAGLPRDRSTAPVGHVSHPESSFSAWGITK
jgi:hypothetical protein